MTIIAKERCHIYDRRRASPIRLMGSDTAPTAVGGTANPSVAECSDQSNHMAASCSLKRFRPMPQGSSAEAAGTFSLVIFPLDQGHIAEEVSGWI